MSHPIITGVQQLRLFGQPIPMAVVKSGDFKVATLMLKGDGRYRVREGKLTPAEHDTVAAGLRRIA